MVDDELDHLMMNLSMLMKGKLSSKFINPEKITIEKLENQLDLLEDALENKFGIDD